MRLVNAARKRCDERKEVSREREEEKRKKKKRNYAIAIFLNFTGTQMRDNNV